MSSQNYLWAGYSLLREVSHGTEATKALSNNAPFLLLIRVVCRQELAKGLAVANNVIRAEMSKILSLLHRVALKSEGLCGNSRTEASSALVQKQ